MICFSILTMSTVNLATVSRNRKMTTTTKISLSFFFFIILEVTKTIQLVAAYAEEP